MNDNEIRFFKRDRDLYGVFSNFAQFPISVKPYNRISEVTFPTVEHYYQSSKAEDYDKFLEIKNAKTPYEAKKLGRKVKLPENWDEIKYFVLLHGVQTKFKTYSNLTNMLINTGDKKIIEDSERDYIWGIGADGTGKNLMGKILEEVRTDLIKLRNLK